MFVTTFYSFKGGVGRTMALVNAGVELALRGRKVLLVDFDLEAPGLDTFQPLDVSDDGLGLIDFVNQYLSTDRSPCAMEFIHHCPKREPQDGDLWFMRAGKSGAEYVRGLNQIDWNDLYLRREGFLLFEELKAQWKKYIDPDFVLIDSSAGHTVFGGIPTRQLPDSVVLVFLPNEQNLRGLTKVVADIRSEAEPLRRKNIQLDFVMSNFPDLDDENRSIERTIKKFQKALKWEDPPMRVHRYNTLSVLDQVVHTTDRPKSRLASEYKRIADAIVQRSN